MTTWLIYVAILFNGALGQSHTYWRNNALFLGVVCMKVFIGGPTSIVQLTILFMLSMSFIVWSYAIAIKPSQECEFLPTNVVNV